MVLGTGLTVLYTVGLVGIFVFIAALAGVQLGLIDGRQPGFNAVTALAAGAVLSSAAEAQSAVLAVISALVLVISLIAFARKIARRRNARRRVDKWVEKNMMRQHYSSR